MTVKTQGRAVKLDGYRLDKSGKLIKRQPKLSVSARIANIKNPKTRYVRGAK